MEERVCGVEGTGWEDVGETEGWRHTKQMTLRFWDFPPEVEGIFYTLLQQMFWFYPPFYACFQSMSHMCERQGYVHRPPMRSFSSLTHTHSQTHNKLFTPMMRQCDNGFLSVSGVWRNSLENLLPPRHNSERGWWDGAPVGVVIAEHD